MAPQMATATIRGEVLGTLNAEMRRNLTGDQPKLFTLWLALPDEVRAQPELPPFATLLHSRCRRTGPR
jgi:hypothetical protein